MRKKKVAPAPDPPPDPTPAPPPPSPSPETSSDPEVHHEIVNTAMQCTNCSKNFVAGLDFRIEGNHVLECPWCGHEHCRVIKRGKITEDRWSSRAHTERVPARRMWKSDVIQAETGSASDFIRRRWLQTIGGG